MHVLIIGVALSSRNPCSDLLERGALIYQKTRAIQSEHPKLIDSVRQGQNLPNKLYLLKPDQEEESLKNNDSRESHNEVNEYKNTENYKKKETETSNLGTSQIDLSGQVKKFLPDKSGVLLLRMHLLSKRVP